MLEYLGYCLFKYVRIYSYFIYCLIVPREDFPVPLIAPRQTATLTRKHVPTVRVIFDDVYQCAKNKPLG